MKIKEEITKKSKISLTNQIQSSFVSDKDGKSDMETKHFMSKRSGKKKLN